jgi:hypothetical protein
MNTASATVSGDEMTVTFGDDAGTRWVLTYQVRRSGCASVLSTT